MSKILVDSNIFLDVITQDPNWSEWSTGMLEIHAERSILLINPIIYAEISVGFDSIEELDRILPPEEILREELPYTAGFLAGKCFLHYRRRGGTKRSPIADFYIGAHAAIRGYSLLTRDTKRYRTYFPKLKLIAPVSEAIARSQDRFAATEAFEAADLIRTDRDLRS